jgi:hypothetical protein
MGASPTRTAGVLLNFRWLTARNGEKRLSSGAPSLRSLTDLNGETLE